jgi:signal transduction histidine kinase
LARLSVSDAGDGLEPAEWELAFNRFWRGRSGAGGSGLGLAIVGATVERHGGRVTAAGSRVTIELPAFTDAPASP